MRRLLPVVLVLAAASGGRASVVLRLTPAELVAGADAVVEGVVGAVAVDWDATGRRLETTTTIAVERVVAGVAPPVVRVVQPGGVLGPVRHEVVGLPELAVGEEVRLHLRHRPDGRGYRVYGWQQGVWSRTPGGGFAPRPPPRPYTYNGMVWPADTIPVPYLVHQAGSSRIPWDDALAAVHAAFATWQDVPCSSLAFTYAGTTDRRMAVDGQNVILWIEDPTEWIYGEEAGAATSLYLPVPEERTADVAFNGVYFDWAVGPPGSNAPHVLDVQGVLVHELGHFSGLSHTESSVDTMYYSWRPWPGQRTLSADDKLGLCSIYPQPGDECAGDGDCPDEETCAPYEHGTLCTRAPDPIGAPCNYDRMECAAFCLFTRINLSEGYCSRYCQVDGDCPATHHCDVATAGASPVRVCFVGPPAQDAGVADAPSAIDTGAGDRVVHQLDGGRACDPATACPVGQYCGGGHCTFDCRTGADCPSGSCTADGRCAPSGGCGAARATANPAPLALVALLVVVAAGGPRGRRRARGPRRARDRRR